MRVVEDNLTIDQESSSIRSKSNINPTKNRPKINQKSSQHRPKLDPKSTQSRPRIGSGADLASETVLGPVLTPFWSQLGAILGAKIGPCWGHVGPKIDFLRLKKALKNDHDFHQL